MSIFILAVIAAIGCGGSSAGPTPNPTPTPPASGEFLFQGNSGASLNLTPIDSNTGALGSPTPLPGQADDEALYPGVAVSPSKQFLFALFTSFTVVNVFQISGPGVQINLTLHSPFFFPNSAPLNSLVLHPTGHFLYVVQSGTLQGFTINAATGDLTPGSTISLGADIRMAAIDPAGKFIYVTDLTQGRIFAFQISAADGSLTAIAGSPFTIASSSEPNVPVIDRTGRFLYVSLLSGIAAFAIDGGTGTLTPVAGSPFPTTSQPIFLAADPQGDFLYACTVTNGLVNGFSINTTTGVLTAVPGSPFATAQAPSNIVVDPAGKFVYVSIEPSSNIFGFSLNPSSGTLTPLAGSPFPSVQNPTNLFIASF